MPPPWLFHKITELLRSFHRMENFYLCDPEYHHVLAYSNTWCTIFAVNLKVCILLSMQCHLLLCSTYLAPRVGQETRQGYIGVRCPSQGINNASMPIAKFEYRTVGASNFSLTIPVPLTTMLRCCLFRLVVSTF